MTAPITTTWRTGFIFPLIVTLLLPPGALAQQKDTPQAPIPASRGLRLLVLEGAGSVNILERGIFTPPVVEVRDSNDRPIEAAEVIFRLPESGPGGAFPGGQKVRKARTNAHGQAAALDFLPNHEAGRFSIAVTATYSDLTGSTTIQQTNSLHVTSADGKPQRGWWGKWKWWIIAGSAAGIATGVILATSGGSTSTPTNPTITITPGPVTIGGR